MKRSRELPASSDMSVIFVTLLCYTMSVLQTTDAWINWCNPTISDVFKESSCTSWIGILLNFMAFKCGVSVTFSRSFSCGAGTLILCMLIQICFICE